MMRLDGHTLENLKTEIVYRRRGNTGVLALSGTVDIFDASTVHAAAVKAANDTKATNIQINLEKADRLDTSILQILLNLRRDLDASQRTIELVATPDNVANALKTLSLSI